MKNIINKVNKLYCDICINIYFGALKIFHLDYFSIHNL